MTLPSGLVQLDMDMNSDPFRWASNSSVGGKARELRNIHWTTRNGANIYR